MKQVALKLFLVLTILLFANNIKAQNQDYFLKNKGYYSLFNQQETQKLNAAFAAKNDTTLLTKYYKFQEKADNFKKMADMPISAKRIKKYRKKQQKFANKAAKYRIIALNSYLSANSTIKSMYITKANMLTATDTCLLKRLRTQNGNFIDSARIANNRNYNNQVEFSQNLDEKYYYDNLAIINLEQQIATLKKDTTISKNLHKKYCPVKPVVVNNNTNNNTNNNNSTPTIAYNIKNDTNLFYTKNENIDLLIKYTPIEYSALDNYVKFGKAGFDAFQLTKPWQDSIEKINKQIPTVSYAQRSVLAQKKITFINEILTENNNALSNYISANKVYFNTRNAHIKDYKITDTTSKNFKLYNSYIAKSNLFFFDADTLLVLSANKTKQDKYKLLRKTNEQLITANKYLENAYNIALGTDTSVVKIKNTPHVKIKPISTNKPDTPVVAKDTTKTTTTTHNTNNQHHTTTTNTRKITALYEYSYANPRPVLSHTAGGTIYRVQVGTSLGLLPVNELKDYNKIYYETTTGSKYMKFLVGDFTNYDDAQTTLNTLKSKGYTTAFIVKYIDGKRKGASYSSSYTNSTNRGSQIINVTSTKYLIYFVQLGTYTSPKTSADLANYKNLYKRNLTDGKIEYFIGPYYRYNQAETALPNVKQKGFTDAKIVAYNNGSNITIDKALRIEGVSANTQTTSNQTNTNTQTTTQTNTVIYRVQVGAFSKYLSDTEINTYFGKLKSSYTFHTHEKNGMIIYSVGNAQMYAEAKNLQVTVKNLGYNDCYVIAFKNGVQVDLSSVIH